MRQKIEKSFQNITVIPFPNYKKERKDFENQVKKLKQEITNEVSKPHTCSSSILLTPQNINDFMKDIMQRMKNNESLDLDSTVEYMERKVIDKAYEDLKKNFSEKCNKIPKTEEEVEKKLNEIMNDLVDTFNKKTKMIHLKSDYLKKVREKIEDALSAKKKKYQGTHAAD